VKANGVWHNFVSFQTGGAVSSILSALATRFALIRPAATFSHPMGEGNYFVGRNPRLKPWAIVGRHSVAWLAVQNLCFICVNLWPNYFTRALTGWLHALAVIQR
jgi:hypothetical protein